jgi:hypothetical protein
MSMAQTLGCRRLHNYLFYVDPITNRREQFQNSASQIAPISCDTTNSHVPKYATYSSALIPGDFTPYIVHNAHGAGNVIAP